MDARTELIEVLTLARNALADPSNDFRRSGWPDYDTAVEQVDGFIAELMKGGTVARLKLDSLFAATGDLCEVALGSGWSEAYLNLSGRFDAAHQRFQASPG